MTGVARRLDGVITSVIPPLALTQAGVDRTAVRRLDEAWLAAAWSDPGTRVFAVSDARAAIRGDGPELALVPSAEAPPGERYFLGTDDDGVAYFAVTVGLAATAGLRLAGLRDVGALLSARDSGLMVHAVGLEAWHAAHGFCARCGHPTDSAAAGHMRRCGGCDTEHYPRLDPAVIMLVTDGEDRCLLGTSGRAEVNRWSTLAGFVEPGESLEQAVAREVAEESGVVVGAVEYVASQPWPFPSSIMLGFVARATGTAIDVDGDELAAARWFSRDELRAAIESGEILPPRGLSISRHLVERWYGGELPAEPARGA
jgi:NAD+ diphosphatase